MSAASAFRAGASSEKAHRSAPSHRASGESLTLGHELMHAIAHPGAVASPPIPAPAAEGSRSVVLALRGLQDKIQHLENERNHYKNAYEQGLTLHDAKITSLRVAHEEERQRLLSELESQAGIARKAMNDRSAVTVELEEERLNSSRTVSHLEHMVQSQKQRLERSDEERERDGAALVDAQECINQLRLQLTDVEHQRDAAESTVQQLSKSLKQVVSLNTNLVERVAQLHLTVSMAAGEHSVEDGSSSVPVRPSSGHAPRYTSQTISSLNRSRDLSPLIGRSSQMVIHGKRAHDPSLNAANTTCGASLNVQQLMNELEMEYQELLTHLKGAAGAIPTCPSVHPADDPKRGQQSHDTTTPEMGSNPTAVVSQLLHVLERKAEQIACLRRCGAVAHTTQGNGTGVAVQRSTSATTHPSNISYNRSMSSPARPFRGNATQAGISQRTTSPNTHNVYASGIGRNTPTTIRGAEKRPLQALHELRSLVQNHPCF